MRSILALGIGSLFAIAPILGAQSIQVVGNPVQPGVPFTVNFVNNTAQWMPFSAAPLLHLLQPTGEMITPDLVGCRPVGTALAPGATATLSYSAPATGPGSAGSFVLLFPYGNGAVARVDVGSASGSFPDLHAYPVGTPFNTAGHHVVFPPNQIPDWEIANTGSGSHTVAFGMIEIFSPGGSVPMATRNLAGLIIGGGGVARITLPLAGLPAGPYTVQTQWLDPGTGRLEIVRHGIEGSPSAFLDLHFPGGKTIPFGGALEARMTMKGLAPTFSPIGMPQGAPLPVYAFLLGFAPGSTPLPGGGTLPLALDPLLEASLTSGVLGLLSNHLGTAAPLSAYCAHQLETVSAVSGIRIQHPGIPALSGLTVRAAALAVDSVGVFAASQPEDITFQ